MAITFVNSCSGGGTANGVTSSAMDTTGANLIVVSVSGYQMTGSNLTDSQSNTWTPLSFAPQSGVRATERLYYCLNPTTGSSHTFTFNENQRYPSISAVAFSGVSSYEAESVSTLTGTATSVQTGSVTPSKDGSLIIAGACTDGGIYTSVDSGFTLETSVSHVNAQHMGSASAYLIQTTAAAVNPQFTNSVSDYLAASIAVFKPAKTGLGDEKLWLCPSLDDSADDISGNGNHGTYNGGMGTVADTSEGGSRAYSFNGSNQAISLTSTEIQQLTTTGSFSAWVYLDTSVTSGFRTIFDRSTTWTPGTIALSYSASFDRLEFVTNTNGDDGFARYTITPANFTGQWWHVCGVLSGGNATLYLDGSQVAQDSTDSVPTTSTSQFVGATNVTQSEWVGKIDDIRVFDRALTTTEITALASKRAYEVPAASATTYHPFAALNHPLAQ